MSCVSSFDVSCLQQMTCVKATDCVRIDFDDFVVWFRVIRVVALVRGGDIVPWKCE